MSVASVAFGATVIEKHFTLRRSDGGVDSAFSLEPDELAALVSETDRAWKALGEVRYGPTQAEQKSLAFRRSIYVSKDIAAGEVFSTENLSVVRPGYGLPPWLLDEIIGKVSRTHLEAGTALKIEDLF